MSLPLKAPRFLFLLTALCVLSLFLFSLAQVQAAALPDPVLDTPIATSHTRATLTLAGGCFWGIQAVFQHVKGVQKAVSGYAGGTVKDPDYETVSSGTSGHAESVQITYDPHQITLGQLLKVYFAIAHDPTELNFQGPDHGTQYRSAFFYTTKEQQKIAAAYIGQLQQAKVFDKPIVTALEPFTNFYPAEPYHQDYLRLHPYNPYIMINDLPKLSALQKEFPQLYVP